MARRLKSPIVGAAFRGDHSTRGLAYLRFTLSYRDVEELLAQRGARPVLGAEIRTADRATATPVPAAAEPSLAPRRDGGADRQ